MARGTSPLVLAVDLGTSALKAGLCDAGGVLHAEATVALEPVRTDGQGGVEADATEWLRALGTAAAELGGGGGLDRVRAVVISGHGPSLVAVDKAGRPLRPAMLWLDRRAAAEAEEIERLWGRPMESWYFLPKALWLARHEPRVLEASSYLLSCPELLDYYLTGTACTVLHTDAFRHYFWREDVLDRLGLDRARFAPFVRPGHALGPARPEACVQLGLPTGVPVYAGGPDFLMSLIGTGAVRPGRGCDRAGSSEGVNLCAASPVSDLRLLCHPHLDPSLWNVSGTVPASGLAVAWLRQTLGESGDSYADLFDAVGAVPPGAGGLLFVPFVGVGRTGALVGLGLGHGRAEIARAVVEGVGFAMREIVQAMRDNELPMEHMTLSGGQARLDRWTQIRADMADLPIRVPRVVDAELVGCAAVGFVALGAYPDVAAASDAMVAIRRVFDPDSRASAAYAELHLRYREAVESVRGL